ncbi:U11/U12 small nuclear ribonucleoprotein 48 kDa protein-like [Uloborus diversus]|uniref:U11/U12 small nuclear ribonucleoprotein 48 kDa protein-like n=1 Tax=Uloborus diversus TaxID=327109 RepID=UPI0024090989|nr:U11/U12 small nuclear ribonucleoprotein 48 kDa protein-like [Uloborus diversus]
MEKTSRLKFIDDLDSYLNVKEHILRNVISKLEWDEESLHDDLKVPCHNDPGHWIPELRLSRHDVGCSWAKDGYPKDEKDKQPPSSQFFYEQCSSIFSINLDKKIQENVLSKFGLLINGSDDKVFDIPKTVDRWTVNLNPEQRLAIYDYIVKESKAANKLKNVTVEDLMFDFGKKDDQDGKPKTRLELMAEQRDYKRRRQSYRAKNVHITKKSYTEVMKEVIENQMSFLIETRKQSFHSSNCEDEDSNKRSSEGESSMEDKKYDSDYRSKEYHTKSHSPKRRKHKRERSRSESRESRHRHKKSRHKHKKSHH